jgi:hypothetical protein
MARRRSTISAIRSLLYALAHLLGDVQAIRRGPEAVAKRLARRAAELQTGEVVWGKTRRR